ATAPCYNSSMHPRLAAALACASAGCIVLCILFMVHSYAQSIEITIPGLARDVHIGYADGSLKFGVFEDPPPTRFWGWGRRRSLSFSNLRDGLDFRADLWGWGVSIPFPLLAFVFAIPPAWWAVVFRARSETQRRIELGLCLHCG